VRNQDETQNWRAPTEKREKKEKREREKCNIYLHYDTISSS
jgi:hypothetical protein